MEGGGGRQPSEIQSSQDSSSGIVQVQKWPQDKQTQDLSTAAPVPP